MRLTQIKLSGFKSFVDSTVIPVPSQLVGVVGPNGCGKSNIIDAVRWVLGETKASELRGESMQDVIFNGSGNRKPAGRAAVELVFDNSEGRAVGQWSVYSEIAVRRVLTRDGTSSYFINNQQVRRRDVHDIFLGTGLGARGYAIIGQGMINRLIEAKPEELRVYLEEAAGVSRYKERRRETENRLADTHENLLRVEDIQTELEKQLEKLESQAEVAGRYRQLQQEGEKKQFALWLNREENAKQDQQRKALEIEAAQTELEGSMAELRAIESEVESRRQAHYQASDLVHQAQTHFYEANTQVSRLETEIRHVVDSRNRLGSRKTQLNAKIQEWQDQYNHCDEQITQIEEELAVGVERLEEAKYQEDELRASLPTLEDEVKIANKEREAMRFALTGIEQNLALIGQQQQDVSRQLQALDVRKERLEQEKRSLDVPEHDKLEELESEREIAQENLAIAQEKLIETEAALQSADEQRASMQQHAQEEAQHLAKLEARLNALVALQEDVQSKGTLEPWLKKYELTGFNRLWQAIHIESGWETALEAVLREKMTALQVHNLDMVAGFATDSPPARLAFYSKNGSIQTVNFSTNWTNLASLIKVNDTDLKLLLNQWLDGVYIANDLSTALKMRSQLKDGCHFVVKEGHMVDAYGVYFYAAESEQAGMLARQQEIENLQKEIRAAQLKADQSFDASLRSEQTYQQVNQSLVPARQQVATLTRSVHDIQLAYTQMQSRVDQSTTLAKRLSQDLEDIHTQTEELNAILLECEEKFEALDTTLAQEQEKYAEVQLQGEDISAKTDALRNKIRESERQIQEIEFSQRSLKSRQEELRRNRDLSKSQTDQAKFELENLEAELFEFDEEATRSGLQDALVIQAEKSALLNDARVNLDNLAASLRESDERRLKIEQSLDPFRAKIMQLQLEEQAARLAVEQFSEQLNIQEVDRDTLRAELKELDDNWQKVTWLQSEVQRITRQIDALGAVNLAALDELNEARQRKTFLDEQHNDLREAIHTLEEAIRKIDKETRELLQDTFNQVNAHFGEMFPRLFGGGEAKLRMTGDEILDAGVQVMAQPPGKRNSTIHLLSGGEKALTATALVFALFKLNPAPFCLLDEVDAPLDDANTERYANLVSSMSDQTQFLFISHNKIAMQMAKQLVGVTMQEQGVSRIVAVDIDSAVKLMGDA
ncbi:chromosome partitioning protein Smc [Pelistega indica]|uniref:Chromosome partition protein Smc n=1 Tax=Pelistega indica TaxID=1414851 RepID=V8G8T7_9BURK|nr:MULTISPECIES: chromosome segregation protein SMC [Pelistega]ETD72491.1 chromosome partitioning protein Smc [Pelistega indica]